MDKKLDLRIVKTYTALTEALESLLLEKPLNEITVSEICEKAMVRRATFYKHFGDKNELLLFIFKEMQEEIKEKQNAAHITSNDSKRDFYQDIAILFDFIEEKEALFLALNNNFSADVISNLVTDSIAQSIKEYLVQTGNIKDAHTKSFTLTCQLLTGALIHGIVWWLKNKDLFTKYEIAEQLNAFVINVIDSEKR